MGFLTILLMNKLNYDMKYSDGEAPVILELWRMRSTPSLPSLPNREIFRLLSQIVISHHLKKPKPINRAKSEMLTKSKRKLVDSRKWCSGEGSLVNGKPSRPFIGVAINFSSNHWQKVLSVCNTKLPILQVLSVAFEDDRMLSTLVY